MNVEAEAVALKTTVGTGRTNNIEGQHGELDMNWESAEIVELESRSPAFS